MPIPFANTLASLSTETHRASAVQLALAGVLLSAWCAWFLLVPVPIYSLSDSARLKVVANVQPIYARSDARIVAVHMALGQKVRAGDALIELDDDHLRLELADQRSQLSAMHTACEALRSELHAADGGAAAEVGQSRASLDAAIAREQEAQTRQAFTREKRQRAEDMGATHSIPVITLLEARAADDEANALITTRHKELVSLRHQLEVRSSDRDAHRQRLRSELARLEGDAEALASRIARLELDVRDRTLRAPVDGTIGEAADLLVGMQVTRGERLGAFVPGGKLEVDARFRPSEAFGRIRAGAVGRMTFVGYPWTQYGSADVRVLGIAQEVRDGFVQVALAVTLPPDSTIPLQHGMPATVEIETGREVPAALVLRAAGRWVRHD